MPPRPLGRLGGPGNPGPGAGEHAGACLQQWALDCGALDVNVLVHASLASCRLESVLPSAAAVLVSRAVTDHVLAILRKMRMRRLLVVFDSVSQRNPAKLVHVSRYGDVAATLAHSPHTLTMQRWRPRLRLVAHRGANHTR